MTRLRQFASADESIGPPDTPDMGNTAVERDFAAALADDLNISEALGSLFKWLNATPQPTSDDVAALRRMDQVLDVLTPRTSDVAIEGLSDDQVERKIAELTAAREAKDYQTSDAIRDELTAAGVEVRISRDGATWKRTMRL